MEALIFWGIAMTDLSFIDPIKARALIERLRQSPRLVVMDTEQTCWEGSLERQWGGPGEAREVIQIGAVALDTRDFSETACFEILARPVINPELSDFCQALTGLSNERLALEAVDFLDAFDAWEAFVGQSPVAVYRADEGVMRQALAQRQDPRPVPGYLRLRDELEAIGVPMEGVNSGKIARRLGDQTDIFEHDALNDARSMATGLAILARRFG